MPLLLLVLAILAPRVVLAILALFTPLISRAYDGWLIPLVGFFVLPLTTIAYAVAVHMAGGVKGTLWLVVMIVAVLLDVGSSGWRLRR